jgi:hypothetical protein
MLRQTALAEMNLQAMVFEPATRRIHLATGRQAAERPYTTIDLRAHFQVLNSLARVV